MSTQNEYKNQLHRNGKIEKLVFPIIFGKYIFDITTSAVQIKYKNKKSDDCISIIGQPYEAIMSSNMPDKRDEITIMVIPSYNNNIINIHYIPESDHLIIS